MLTVEMKEWSATLWVVAMTVATVYMGVSL